MRIRSLNRLLTFSLVLLVVLLAQSSALAAGVFRHHKITSRILADAGEPAERELSVYLPEGYDVSDQAYPVVYLLHGKSGNNRSLTGSVNLDRLIQEGEIRPLIAVFPDMHRAWDVRADWISPYDSYMVGEIIPFIDQTYHTIPRRESRAITGYSLGGFNASIVALLNSSMFSMLGGCASGYPPDDFVKSHIHESLSMRFWIYVGKNDNSGALALSRAFASCLEDIGLSYVYIEDDGTHSSNINQRLEENIEFFSEFMDGSFALIKPGNGVSVMWGHVKSTYK